MRKLLQMASLIAMGMMIFSIAPASAAFIPHKVALPDSTVCTAICGTPPIVADDLVRGPLPTIDPCARHLVVGGLQPATAALQITINGSDGLNGVNHPPRVTCGGKAQLSDCATPLGHLPNVSEREVRSVDRRDRIRLIPICDRLNASLTQVQNNLAVTGNAETLVPAIADNSVLTAALERDRYRADDVVGIVMGTNTVLLYVHKI